MLDQVIGLPWFWGSLLLALLLFFGVARRLAPIRWPKTAPGGHLLTAGLVSGLVAVAVAALISALAGVYLRMHLFGIEVADYLLPFFLVMAGVLGVLRLVWPRDFATPVVNGYSIPGSVLQGIVMAGLFLLTVGGNFHFHFAWPLPATDHFLLWLLMAIGLWFYFIQEEALKSTLARSRGLFFALALGLGSKLIIGMVWYGSYYLPNPHSFSGMFVLFVVTGLLLIEMIVAVLRDWRFGPISISVFVSLAITWGLSVGLLLV